jgi:hemoglobin
MRLQSWSDDTTVRRDNGAEPKTARAVAPSPPQLEFAAAVALRFDSPLYVGATPDGVRFDFRVHGTVEGPLLRGKFPPCAAYLLIDSDGIGTINVRAPLLLNDGAVAELEATGRYDFGKDGYDRAVAGNLCNSALGWCPRFLTGDPRYVWLNRAVFLGVGELRPLETRVDYDLFVLTPASASLYERLGGRKRIGQFMGAFIDAIHQSPELQRQNRYLAGAFRRAKLDTLKEKVADLVSELTGGPDKYAGRPLKAAHAHLGITDSDWEIALGELVRVLTEHGVQQAEQRALLKGIEHSKSEIVATHVA